MNTNARLTRRERDIAELLAWGASKKEVAVHLFISSRTVENHTRNIYEKTACTKVNELSAWWFCFRFRIPITLSPFAKKFAAAVILAVYIFGASSGINYHQRIIPIYQNTRIINRNNINELKNFAA